MGLINFKYSAKDWFAAGQHDALSLVECECQKCDLVMWKNKAMLHYRGKLLQESLVILTK